MASPSDSRTDTSPTASLPPELWLDVFRWATGPPPHIKHSANHGHRPFAAQSTAQTECPEIMSSLALKYAFALVCRQWRALVLPLSWEFIVLDSQSRSRSVHDVLKQHPQYGEYVKSAVIRAIGPSNLDTPNWMPAEGLQALLWCPNIVLIMMPWWFSLPLPFNDGGVDHSHSARHLWAPPVPSGIPYLSTLRLTRLDWEFNCTSISIFHSLVQFMPNLRYLYLSCVSQCHRDSLFLDTPVHLPSVTTLRLHIQNPHVFGVLQRWRFPALTHLIMDACPRHLSQHQMQSLIQTFSLTLRVVELGSYMRYLLTDYITPIINGAASLETLAFYISFTALVMDAPLEHKHMVKHIHVHIKPSFWSKDAHSTLEVAPMDVLHFSQWCTGLQGLESITLHGNWQNVLTDRYEKLVDARRIMGSGGWRIEFEGGQNVEFPNDD